VNPDLVNGNVSFWQSTLGEPPRRARLGGHIDADVCVVGAGYTGLWTAWALARSRPDLRVVVVEREHVGFAASGRNGGWLSGLLPGDRELLARAPGGRDGVVALQRHLIEAVDEVLNICADEGIDADQHKGGTLAVATLPAQWSRLQAGLDHDRRWGLGVDDVWALRPDEVTARVRVPDAQGGVFSPHCARVQPAKLVRGLADAATRRGVEIYESTEVTAIEARRARTPHGDVTARWVVRATEGFSAQLPGLARLILPMNSSMIVTAPLDADTWAQIGWADAETLRDAAHVYSYAQRTRDGRIALGGRGSPYRFASRTDNRGRTDIATIDALRASLGRLWPAAQGVSVDHAWCGVLGVTRDWTPSVGVDPEAGLAWAGGYVGDGVTTSYLAGLTVADLILGEDTDRTRLPWVGRHSRAWEPEPLRWLGVHGIYGLYRAADRAERTAGGPGALTKRTSRWATLADRISGRP
jgi:glycine/D-amino acid oxidase-like deaminating enzyme